MNSTQIIYLIFIALNFARQVNGASILHGFDSDVEIFDPVRAREPQFEEQKVESTKDIIQLLQQNIQDPFVVKLVEILKIEEVRLVIDGVFTKYPQLPAIIKGLKEFFDSPTAKPLVEALEQSIPQLRSAVLKLYEKIQAPLEEALEVFVEEGVIIFFRLQSPGVMSVIQKLQELPEIQQLATYLNNYNIDLLKLLKKLEAIIQGGL